MIDLIGERYGALLVVRELEPRVYKTRRHRVLLCLCDCGRERSVQFSNLRSGNSQSCGTCVKRVARQDSDETCLNLLLGRYRYSAKLRSLSFTLTRDEFKNLLLGDCHYCGGRPSNEWTYKRKDAKHSLIYNGIDRVDSVCGYEPGNVVSCCKVCNRAKADLSTEEWLAWIARVYSTTMEGGDFRG